jgi:HD-GYP domain-containing protein (c-di-GMP phosphodiesterase class II)
MSHDEVQLAELVGALSHALDMTEGQPVGHSIRACWIGVQVGIDLGLNSTELTDLYYTILLKDIGCSTTAARVCQLYLTDDIMFKRKAKFLDHTAPQFLRYLIANAGMKQNLLDRFKLIIDTALQTGEISFELTDTRCHRGADIARQMRFSEAVALGITDLDEHWDGKGLPRKKTGAAISLNARVALLAQVTDVFFASEGPAAALAEVKRRTGTWFDPQLVNALMRIGADPAFWTSLSDPGLQERVVAFETIKDARPVNDDYLDDIAAAFAEVIDAKTPYTSGHSDRVALFSNMIAVELNLSDDECRHLRRAALLHDIGKLGVSNSILDKPGKLDDDEWAEIKRHPALGRAVLSRVAAFRDLAEVAGNHHERLDGKGYPRGLAGDAIDLHSRIVAVADVFDALTADRPYRKAMSPDQALAILDEMTGPALDTTCVTALKAALVTMEAAKAA